RAVGALARVAVDDLRAVRGDKRLSLRAHVPGHHELHAVTLRGAHEGVSDAGVAGGGVDDRLVLRQRSAAFPVLDHRERRAVLDRAAGVEPFGLRVDLHARELPLEDAHAQKRRAAYELGDPGAHEGGHRFTRIGRGSQPVNTCRRRLRHPAARTRWSGRRLRPSQPGGRITTEASSRRPQPDTAVVVWVLALFAITALGVLPLFFYRLDLSKLTFSS